MTNNGVYSKEEPPNRLLFYQPPETTLEDYDDDDEKNDETFGSGAINDDWEEEHNRRKDDIELFKQQQKKLMFVSQNNTQSNDEEPHISSVLKFMDDDDEKEQIVFDKPLPLESKLLFFTPTKTPVKQTVQKTESLFSENFITAFRPTPEEVALQTKQQVSQQPQETPEMLSVKDLERQLLEVKIQNEKQEVQIPQNERHNLQQQMGGYALGMQQNVQHQFPQQIPQSLPQQIPQKFSPSPQMSVSPNQQFRQQQLSPPRFESRPALFQDYECVSGSELEFVLRQQQKGLEPRDPYIDDFYHCAYISRRAKKYLFPPSAVIVSLRLRELGYPDEQRDFSDAPRVFGRIPSQSVRAPRKLVDMEQKELVDIIKEVDFAKHKSVQMYALYENGIDILLLIEDLILAKRQCTHLGLFTDEMEKKLHTQCNKFLALIKLLYLTDKPEQKDEYKTFVVNICEKRKGVKLICRALRVLPEPYSTALIDACLYNWGALTKTILSLENGVELMRMLAGNLCFAITSLSFAGLCNRLRFFVSKMDISSLLKTNEGPQLFMTLLKRGDEVNAHVKNNEWDILKAQFVDLLRKATTQLTQQQSISMQQNKQKPS